MWCDSIFWPPGLAVSFSVGKKPVPQWNGSILTGRRNMERRVSWKWLGRPSFKLVALVGIYLIANAVLCSTILALHRVNHFASRFGWYVYFFSFLSPAYHLRELLSRLTRLHRMAAANMALCVFLGLKNTPLVFITPLSHIELNTCHRIVGYMTAFQVLLHAILYTVHFGRGGRWEKLLEAGNVEGIPAGVAMFILLMGIFRHNRYELFYISHVLGFVTAVVLVGLHRPDWAKKLPIVALFTASLWVLDRFIRAARLSYNLLSNEIRCYPLPDGGTRLVLKKPSAGAALPGSHCFLWVPGIRFFQTHPFSIVSISPSGLELVVKSHRGFTKAINEFAKEHPGRATWASVDGPYGSVPDTAHYDKLVLIAGGSGAAFTFGLINRALHTSGAMASQSVNFVLALKRNGTSSRHGM